jgi:hypothetical protein
MRTLLSSAVPALLVLALAPPAGAARGAGPVYKVSAYGVQRVTTSSTETSTGRCFDRRGSSQSSVVIRFKTPRAMRVRFQSYGSVAAMIPVDRSDPRLSGTVATDVSQNLEKAGCHDLNPDGSQKWVPVPAPENCGTRSFDDYTAGIRLSGRVVEFDAQQPELTPLVPLSCTGVMPDIASVKKRISMRQIVESADTPIRIQTSSSETTSAPDGSSTSTTKRLTTVYIQVRRA